MDSSAAAPAFLQALETSWLGELARQSLWLYPLAGVTHVIGLSLLLGSIVAFDLRVLGVARRLPLAALGHYLLPLAASGFCLQAASGSVMLAADATQLAGNPAFQLKLSLITLAGLNIAFFHLRARPGLAALVDNPLPGLLKLSAAVSLSIWLTVAVCGRLIAYF